MKMNNEQRAESNKQFNESIDEVILQKIFNFL